MLGCFHFQILERFLVGCRHGRSLCANHQSKQRNHEQREQAIHWPSLVPSLTCPLASANVTTALVRADVGNWSQSLCKGLSYGLVCALARTPSLRTLLRIFPLGDESPEQTRPRRSFCTAPRAKPRTPSTLPRGAARLRLTEKPPGFRRRSTSRLAVLVQKPKHVGGPDRASEIAKVMAILHGAPKGWIDPELEFLAGILHGVRKHSARGKVVIILGLKEKDGSTGFANAAHHQ